MSVIEIPTHAELMELGKAAAKARTTKITEQSFTPGFMFDVLNGLSAAIGEEAIRVALELFRRTFFRTAAGSDLDALADDHFGLRRQSGVGALGSARFTRPSVSPGNILIPSSTRLATADGAEFLTLGDVLLTGLQIDVDIRAVETGEASNVGASTITVIRDALADASISVSNPEATAGGLSTESDDRFRERVRGFLTTVRRGTREALVYGAKQVPGVVQASVDVSADPIAIYIADVTGSANATLVAAVIAELDSWRAAGISVAVFGATIVEQDIEISVTFDPTFDTSATRDQLIRAVLDEASKLTIGETLYRSRIQAAALISGVRNAVILDPAGDVVPAANQLLTFARERITLA